MSEEIKVQVQQIQSEIELALWKFYEDPSNRCSECGRRRDRHPTGLSLERERARRSEPGTLGAFTWQVVSSRAAAFAPENAGWVELRPEVSVSGRLNVKWFCPACATKRGIGFGKEHA